MQDEVQEHLEKNQASPRAENILSFHQNDQEVTRSTGTNMQLELLDNQAMEAVDAWYERMSLAMEQVRGNSSHSIRDDRLLAVQNGDGASFAGFLASGVYDVDVQDPITLDTPLMLAAKLGCLDIVLLLELTLIMCLRCAHQLKELL
ncbi:hypothetical protein AeRB84_017981 [Aphanomyces euteiches]|nr:hypothetical protein AeRB84_017981 [Aphanomyces euteiches]